MCGILAVFGYERKEAIRKAALRATQRIRHRGPDWSGIMVPNPKTAITHERLSIVDVEHGAQPLTNTEGTVILTVNGEIFNHRELRRDEVPDYSFTTLSDCECIIPLYLKYGADFVHLLRGQFAFVLYDMTKELYLVVRDPIGIASLYQGWGSDGSYWVSSELKALVDVCERIEPFPPGSHLLASTGATQYGDKQGKPVRYYNPSWATQLPTLQDASEDTWKTRVHDALTEAVRRRLMCDVPYGVLLSGGLDSSLVAAIAARMTKRRVESGGTEAAWYPRLHSYCIGLPGSPDLAAARDVAAFIGTVHHELTFTVQEGLDAISDVIRHLETYDVTTVRASTPMYLLARKIKVGGCKCVLSGEGSDELFGGYLYFAQSPSNDDFHRECVSRVLNLHLSDCLRADKSTMAWGVEARVPFLDADFIDVAMSIPGAMKAHTRGKDGTRRIEKHILRAAFDDPDDPYLPPSVLWRQKEQFSDGVGFSWIDSLRSSAEDSVTDAQMAKAAETYPLNTPQTKEAYRYRELFEEHFPQKAAAETVSLWVPRTEWGCSADPSGRAQTVHDSHDAAL